MEKKYIIAANIILFLSLLLMYHNSEVEVFQNKKSWLANWISIVSVTYIKVLWRNNIGLE